MLPPFYSIEVVDINGETIDTIEKPVSVAGARAFNTVGNCTITVLDDYPEEMFQFNTRLKLWRTGVDWMPALFGDTVWFVKKFTHNVTEHLYVIEASDAMILLTYRVVAYTSLTPYADKTLEENQDVVYADAGDYYRIDNLMKEFVRENYGPDALDETRNNTFILVEENKSLAPYGEKQAAWATLNSVLLDLARMSAEAGVDLFYDLIPQEGGKFLFRVWSEVRGIDRGLGSDSPLIFSDGNNDLVDISVVRDFSNTASFVYALGYDSGPSQIIEPLGNDELIRSDPFGRVEITTNISDSDVDSVLRSTAASALNGRRPVRLVSATLSAGSASRMGSTFNYGDRVGVQVEGREFNAMLSAVSTRWEDDEEELEVRLNGSESLGNPVWWEGYEPGDNLPTDNESPVVSAGVDAIVLYPAAASLDGTVSDDGFPSGTLTQLWTQVSGPGTATFADATAVDTTVTFDVAGIYVLRLTASDGDLEASDDVIITSSEMVLPVVPEYGLRSGQEQVAAVCLDGFIYRTQDFQTLDADGGPTWDRVDTGIEETIFSYVVDPFSPGYIGYAPEDDPARPSPEWYEQVDGVDTPRGRGRTVSMTVFADGGGGGGVQNLFKDLHLRIPTNAVRVKVSATWEAVRTNATGGLSSNGMVISALQAGAVARSGSLGFTVPPDNGSSGGTAVLEYTHAAPWPDPGIYYRLRSIVNRSGDDAATAQTRITVTVLEIELADGTIYTPIANPDMVEGAINCYIATERAVYRVEDMFGTCTTTKIHTFPVVALSSAGCYRAIQASFGAYFPDLSDNPWLMVVTNYSNTAGHARSWATHSLNAGVTWSNEVRVGTSSATAQTAVTGHGFDLWLSPRTPGLAYVIVDEYTAPANKGYISTDWGATWSLAVDPALFYGDILEGTIHVPYLENDDENIVWLGHNEITGGVLFYRLAGVEGDFSTEFEIAPIGSYTYGTYSPTWGVRTYDSDPAFMVMAAARNSVNTAFANNRYIVAVSADYGVTWSSVTSEMTDSDAHPRGVAFAGNSEQAIFVWGTKGYIEYSGNFGATLDDKFGNLLALNGGPLNTFIGIAGGPLP